MKSKENVRQNAWQFIYYIKIFISNQNSIAETISKMILNEEDGARAQKRQAVLLTSSDDQKMQKKNQDLKKIFEKKEELDFKNCIW